MTLKIGSLSLDNGTIELTPQQQRTNDIEQNNVSLKGIESKLESASGHNVTFDKYPDGVREFLQGELAKNCYIQHGENPDIQSVSDGINPTTHEKYIHAQVDEFLYTTINPDKLMEKYAAINPTFDLAGTKLNLAQQAHQVEVERTFNAEKGALSEAFKNANNERLMAVVARSHEIDNTSWLNKRLGRVPEPIPNVIEQPLSKEEILKHVDPKVAESETFQKMLDELVTHLDRSITKDIGVEFWDTMWQSGKDTAKTVDAFVEVAVAEGLNTGTKIGMNVGAVALGTYHGIKEGSLDEGITAMQEIRDGAVNDYRVEARESSKEILAHSENLQAVGNTIHNGMEWSYGKIGEHLGDEAQFIARGAMEAAGDIAFVFGAGAGATRIVKGVDGAVVNFKYAQINKNTGIAEHLRDVEKFVTNEKGIYGGHNKDNFMQGLKDYNLQITKETQGTKAISAIYYGRERFNGRGQLDGFKEYANPKTVYDPKIYTDEQIFEMGKKAVVQGYSEAHDKFIQTGGKTRAYTQKVDGINFRVFLDKQTGALDRFHPTLKGK